MKKWLNQIRIAWLSIVALAVSCAAMAETGETAASEIDLTSLINAVIAVLAGFVTYRLVPWLKALTTATQQELIGAAIKTAVYAAEQLYKTDVISDRLDYAEEWLRGKGYTVSRAEIEAAVKEMQGNVVEFANVIDIEEVKTDG